MRSVHHLKLSLWKEGWNLLKVFPSHLFGNVWSRPVSINLILTTRCNSKCSHCDSWKLEDHASELSLEEFQNLAFQTQEMNIPIVTLGGGEPLLRKNFWEIVRCFTQTHRSVQLTTNGLSWNEEKRKKLFESGISRVTVSFDSHVPEIYRSIRGVDGVSMVEKNLRLFLKEKPEELEIDTNTVLCNLNAETFLETLDFLVSLGIKKTNFSAVTTAPNNYLMTESKKPFSQISPEKIQILVKGLMERKQKHKTISASTRFIKGLPAYFQNPQKTVYPCYAGYLTLDVFQDGSVHCCGNMGALGNLRSQPLKEIWKGKPIQSHRKKMVKGMCSNCYLSCKAELSIAANPKYLPSFAFEKLELF